MKLLIRKLVNDTTEDMTVEIEINDTKEQFDYIKLVDYLYENPSKSVVLEYSDNVADEEKKKIEALFSDIKKKMQDKEKNE